MAFLCDSEAVYTCKCHDFLTYCRPPDVNSRSGLFWINVILCIHTNCYLPVSKAVIRFSDLDFIKAIIWRSDDVFRLRPWPLKLWHLSLNVSSTSVVGCHVIKLHTKFDRNGTVHGEVINDLANCRRHYITLWPWPMTPWPWMFVVERMSCDQTLYQTWAKSNNLLFTSCGLKKMNVCHWSGPHDCNKSKIKLQ